MNEHAYAKNKSFTLNHQYICSFCRIFFTKLCVKMSLNYVITEWFTIPFSFMQNVCKMAINRFSHYIQFIYKLICILMCFWGNM